MTRKNGKLDTTLLAVSLTVVSGLCLAYNIYTAESTELTLTLRELAVYEREADSGELMSAAAAANLAANDSVAVSVTPTENATAYELLPPAVKPAE